MHCSCLNINQLESVNVCDWHVLWESVRLFVVTASVDRLVTTRLCAFAGWWWRGRQSWGLGTAAGCRQPTQTRVLTADCRVTLTATKVLPSCLRCQCWGFLKLHCSSFEHLSQFTLVTCWSSYYLETVSHYLENTSYLSASLPVWTHFSLSSIQILAFFQYKSLYQTTRYY